MILIIILLILLLQNNLTYCFEIFFEFILGENSYEFIIFYTIKLLVLYSYHSLNVYIDN